MGEFLWPKSTCMLPTAFYLMNEGSFLDPFQPGFWPGLRTNRFGCSSGYLLWKVYREYTWQQERHPCLDLSALFETIKLAYIVFYRTIWQGALLWSSSSLSGMAEAMRCKMQLQECWEGHDIAMCDTSVSAALGACLLPGAMQHSSNNR